MNNPSSRSCSNVSVNKSQQIPIRLIIVWCVLAMAGCKQTGNAPVVGNLAGARREMMKDQRMQWWRQGRFGMFIHWGIYSVPAGEWKGERVPGIGEWIMERAKIPVAEYELLAKQFNPVKFNADEWVRVAKEAGMKYIVITSKHHDGFCLWDSKVTDYDITDATPFERDVLKELSKACKKHGVKLCFYHSIMDWHHPDAQAPFYPNYNDTSQSNPDFARYVENYLKPQVKELITQYGPLGVLWFDGEWIKDWTEPMGKDMYDYVRSLQPDIIINNRVGKGRKGMEGLSKSEEYAGDFGTPEQQIPPTGLPGVDWETCMTMNDTWGYKSYDHNWKSAEDLLHKLADIASKGGNFLLNVGPTAEGLIPEPSVERLAAIGKWMKVNAESIHGTTASPLGRLPWGRCTAKPGKLYLHVFDWPKDGKLAVPNLTSEIKRAYLLADKKASNLAVSRQEDGQVVITVPAEAPDRINTVVVLIIKK
jgi:alpha-L-fucosidase